MKLDDHLMTILTGLVLAVVVGTLAQESDTISELMGGEKTVAANDDVFFVKAGSERFLEILANDDISDPSMAIRVLDVPACGEVTVNDRGLSYAATDSCDGADHLTYCLVDDDTCHAASVTINLRAAPLIAAAASIPVEEPVETPVETASKAGLVPVEPEITLKPLGETVPIMDASSTEETSASAFVVSLNAPERQDQSKYKDPYLNALWTLTLGHPTLEDTPSATSDALILANLDAEAIPLDPIAARDLLLDYKNIGARSDEDAAGIASANATTYQLSVPLPPAVLRAAVPGLAQTQQRSELDPMPTRAASIAPDLGEPGEPNLDLPSSEVVGLPSISATLDCEADGSISRLAGAHMRLSVHAPCIAGEAVIVAHGGIEFLFEMSLDGDLLASIPALDPSDSVTVLTQSGAFVSELEPNFEEFGEIKRVVAVFPTEAGVELEAQETSDTTSEPRVVSVANVVPHAEARRIGHGYIRAYQGADGFVVRTYTLPVNDTLEAPAIAFRVVGADQTQSCGSEIDVLVLDASAKNRFSEAVVMPACGDDQQVLLGRHTGAFTLAAQ